MAVALLETLYTMEAVCRVSTVPAVVLNGCVKLASLALHDNPISAAQLRNLEGFAEYDLRRRRKHNKQVSPVPAPTACPVHQPVVLRCTKSLQIDHHVMSSQGFDEGATASDWQHWGSQ